MRGTLAVGIVMCIVDAQEASEASWFFPYFLSLFVFSMYWISICVARLLDGGNIKHLTGCD